MNKHEDKVKKKQKQPSLGGMYITGLLFCLIVVVLCVVQNSVPYKMRDESIQLIDRDEILQVKLGEEKNEDAEYVLLYEEGNATVDNALDVICPVLEQTKISYDMCSTEEMSGEKLYQYKNLIIAVYNFKHLGEYATDIKEWIYKGGNLLVLFPPEKDGSFMTFSEVFGVKDVGGYEVVSEIRILNNFLLCGNKEVYPILDAYESSLAVTLKDNCTVYLETDDKYPVPLVWRTKYGEGNVVFDNFGIMGKSYRGIHCAAMSLMEDSFVYPVINGAAFYIDDFPSPVPEGDGQFITRDYNMSIDEFYSQVWWNDVYDLAVKHDIKYTGLIIEDYSNQVSGIWNRNQSVDRYLYFGNMLLGTGGEIGIHGYNHMPLVLQNFDFKDEFDDYIQWPTTADMGNSIDELIGFTEGLFPQENIQVYVPPSNIISDEGIEVLNSRGINIIASVYLKDEFIHEQEFEVSESNGVINTPRIISGYVFNDFMNLAALSELNFHLVSTHFQHPDDVLDVDRGAELGWQKMYAGLVDYTDWLYGTCPDIRNLTGSEMAAAVERYDIVQVEREISDKKIVLKINNFYDEAFLVLDLNENQSISEIAGASYLKLNERMYLLECSSERVEITLK